MKYIVAVLKLKIHCLAALGCPLSNRCCFTLLSYCDLSAFYLSLTCYIGLVYMDLIGLYLDSVIYLDNALRKCNFTFVGCYRSLF